MTKLEQSYRSISSMEEMRGGLVIRKDSQCRMALKEY